MTARLREVFATRGGAAAVVDGDLRLTYADLDRETAGLAALLAAHGVGRGDRVAVMLPNGADAVRAVVAVLRLGAVIVPLSERAPAAEVAHIVEDAEPALLIHAPEFAGELPEGNAAVPMRLDTSAPAWRDALRSGAPAPPPPDLAPEDLLGVLYTSGTTGRHKGAMLTHLNVVHSCLHWTEVFALTPDDRTLLCVPWAHVSGLCGVVLPFLFLGATQVVLGPFKRRACLELAERERVTHALMVPAMYNLYLLEPDLAAFRLGAWRIAAYGGATMPVPTILRSRRRCRTWPCATATARPRPPPPPPSCHRGGLGADRQHRPGRPLRRHPGDGRGRRRGDGGRDGLWISGPMVSPGYWRNAEARVAADVAAGHVSHEAAERVYGVAIGGDSAMDPAATAARRAALTEERRGWRPLTARSAAAEVTPATGAPDRSLHEYVLSTDRANRRVLACARCGANLASYADSYKSGALCDESPVTLIPSAADPARHIDDAMVFRRFCCPGCHVQLATEIVRAEEPLSPRCAWRRRPPDRPSRPHGSLLT